MTHRTMIKPWILCGLCLLAPHAALADDANSVEAVDVFVSGAEGYHTYRIPSVIATPDGTLLAFCEGRKTGRGDHGDIDLVAKRSVDGGKSWGPLELVYEEGGAAKTTIGNPCPVVDQATGTIWLPFCRDNDDVFVTHSSDDGESWSEPVEITGDVKKPGWGWYATGPGVGVQLQAGPHRGRLVIPCDHREEVDGRDTMFSHIFYSDDQGKTWKLGGSVEKHTDECQVAELNDGRLMINMRNYWGRTAKVPEHGGMRAVSYSDDGGETWSPLEFHEKLVEPVCQASLLRYSPISEGGNNVLLFSNPASTSTRERLTVRMSKDEGRTWAASRVLHLGPSAYSCLVVLPDQSIGCLFERGDRSAYESIRFARLSLAWLTTKDRGN